MSRVKYLVALLLVASSTTFAADFESAAELRQCGKDLNSLNESRGKVESVSKELSGLDLRATFMRTRIEIQEAWVADYNARMRLNADLSEYNAFVRELSRRYDRHNRNIDKFNERLQEFRSSCLGRSFDPDGDMYKEVCKDTNEYFALCRLSKEN